MNALIDAAIDRSRMVVSALVALFIAGTVAYIKIPKEAEPELSFPLIFISLTLEGVSPGDAERLLIRPLEEEASSLPGLKESRSTAFEGGARTVLEFEMETNIQEALADVRAAMDRARPELPADADEPSIREFDMSGHPILSMSISGPVPERTLLHLARDLRDRIAQIGNVLDANVYGVREEQVEIIVDPLLVEHYGLNNTELFTLFSRSNKLVAAGNLDTGQGRFAVTLPGLFEDINDIWSLPVKADENGIVKFSDIAEVRRTFKDASSFVRVDGNPAASIDVTNRRGTNIFNTVQQVRQLVEREQKKWPEQVTIDVINDRSVNVKAQLDSIQNGVVLAIFLVMALCMAALGVRSGLLVGLSIPGSFLAGILILFAAGQSINFVVIFGLILSVGLLVDGAIVVVENADRRIALGQEAVHAYAHAAHRMAWPIVTSTGTTIAAFVPLLFWPGFVGQFMGLLPMTVISVLSASLVMAMIFVPTVGARTRFASGTGLTKIDEAELVKPDEATGVTRRYLRILNIALDHPGKVIFMTLLLLFLVPAIYLATGGAFRLNPPEEARQATVKIHALGNMSLEEQDQLIGEVERRLEGLPDIRHLYTRTGRQAGANDEDQDVIGEIRLVMKEWNERRSTPEVIKDVVQRTENVPGVNAKVRQQLHMSSDVNIEIEVASRFPDILSDTARIIRRKMDQMDGLSNVNDTLPMPGIEWQLEVDRAEAAKYNADITLIGESIRLITNGLRLGTYRPDDSEDEIDIAVRYPEEYRSIRMLDTVPINTNGGLVPISNFVTRKPIQKTAEIQRVDGHRILELTASTLPGVLPPKKVQEIKDYLATQDIDPRVSIVFKGEEMDQKENTNFLIFAFSLSMFLMAMILLAQFNSFYSVMLILSSVILSTIGVFLGLIITGTPFIITMSGIGIIALAGIVVNNNIVLIDTFNRFKTHSTSIREAIIKTGAERLRPVFLTTATTVLGLIPMAMQIGVDFFNRNIEFGSPALGFWQYLAMAIVFGLIFATVLTLVVTPAALMAQHNLFAPRHQKSATVPAE